LPGRRPLLLGLAGRPRLPDEELLKAVQGGDLVLKGPRTQRAPWPRKIDTRAGREPEGDPALKTGALGLGTPE